MGNTLQVQSAGGIDEQLLSLCGDFVAERFGLHFPKKRWRDLARRIAAAQGDLGFTDAASCIRWLISAELTGSQLDTLACHLTIGETYFFRERKSFDLLEAHVLPELISSRQGKEQRLRIWSAGCSTGEEAYSIAILLQRMIPDLSRWNVTLLATDLNSASLRKAAIGEYGDWSFRGIPRWTRERYFTEKREGRFEISGAVRKMVTFAQLNLAEDPYPSLSNNTNAMDIIFCRNVLMYFAPELVKRVVEGLRHSLVEGGWLIVSPCEASHTLFSDFETVNFNGAIFYRKNDRRKAAPAPPPMEAAGGTTAPFILPESAPATQPPCSLPSPAKPLPAPEPPQDAVRPQASPYDEALLLYRQGLHAEAAAKLTELLAGRVQEPGCPDHGKAAALLTRLCANRGDFAAALEWSEKAIAANKLDPEVRYLQAMIFQEQGVVDTAIAALQKTLYLDQTFVLAHFALANLSLQRGMVKEGGRHLRNAASFLAAYGEDDIVPGSEGMSARRLGEIIASTMGEAAD